MPMVRSKPAAGWFPTPREPRASMGDHIILTQLSLFKPICDGEPEEMLVLVTSAFSTEPSAQSAGTKQEEKDDWSPFLSALAAHEQEVCPWTKKNPRRSLPSVPVRREVRSPCVWLWNVTMSAMCRWIRFFSSLRKKKFVKLPNRILLLANWTFYRGKELASSCVFRYNVIDEVSFPLWRYTWKRTKK